MQLLPQQSNPDAALVSLLQESTSDTKAVCRVVEALQSARSVDEVVMIALNTVRDAFDWAYGSYWMIGDDGLLHFALESGDAGQEFREVTLAASFAEGVGLSGRAWRSRDLFFVADLGDMTDCVRAPAAQRVGVKSGVCFPIESNGEVVGTMDFFATRTLEPSQDRLDVLRSVGKLVSATFERFAAAEAQEKRAVELQRQATAAMRVVDSAQSAARTVEQLSESSNRISGVTQVISSIAKKTNLLALNATIEAARAGEAGKGFGVVASEVKALARATATATQEVDDQVASIRRDTELAIEAINEIKASLND